MTRSYLVLQVKAQVPFGALVTLALGAFCADCAGLSDGATETSASADATSGVITSSGSKVVSSSSGASIGLNKIRITRNALDGQAL